MVDQRHQALVRLLVAAFYIAAPPSKQQIILRVRDLFVGQPQRAKRGIVCATSAIVKAF